MEASVTECAVSELLNAFGQEAGVGRNADRKDHNVGRIAVLVGLDGSYLVVFAFEGHDALAEMDVHAVLFELCLDHFGKFRVKHIEQAVERLDDVNLGNLLQNGRLRQAPDQCSRRRQ